MLHCEEKDKALLLRGIAMLLIIIIGGVVAAESQINSLTRQHPFAESFNIRRDSAGTYTIYLFGNEVSFAGMYGVAEIDEQQNIVVFVASKRVLIPTRISLNYQTCIDTLMLWYGQFMAEAEVTARSVAHYAHEGYDKLSDYLRQFR